jgi:hypothetical protein
MPSGAEIAQALYGAWRFAWLDRQAWRCFDLSHRGVWRSFWAAALCYPGFALLLWMRADAASIARAGFPAILIIETIGYVIAWTAFPLLALTLCRQLGREARGFDFIAIYNWAQVPQTALFVVIALVSLGLPTRAAANLELAGDAAVLIYEWFIASVVVGGGWTAAALVALDLGVAILIALVASRLY